MCARGWTGTDRSWEPRIGENGGVGGGEEDIKTRERELRVLNGDIASLTKRVKGWFVVCSFKRKYG